MLWTEPCTMIYCAALGGLIGGAVATFANRQTNRFNMRMMEDYWNSDIKRLESRLEVLDQKISTVSVAKPVNNHDNKYRNKGYNHQRHFNQRG